MGEVLIVMIQRAISEFNFDIFRGEGRRRGLVALQSV
jgi:hypothetical protein